MVFGNMRVCVSGHMGTEVVPKCRQKQARDHMGKFDMHKMAN